MRNRSKIMKWLLHTMVCTLALSALSSCIMGNGKLEPCDTLQLRVIGNLFYNDAKVDWANDSRISVIVMDETGSTPVYPEISKIHSLGSPIENRFNPISDANTINRPGSGITRVATGVYPHNVPINNQLIAALSVEDQSNPQVLDLIVAEHSQPFTLSTQQITLDFHRRMCQLEFVLSITERFLNGTEVLRPDKLAGAGIQIDGMEADGAYSLKDNTVITSNGVSFTALMNASGQNGSAVVFPRNAGAGVEFEIFLPNYPGKVYRVALDPTQALEAGKSYVIPIDLLYETGTVPDGVYCMTYEYADNFGNNLKVSENSNVWTNTETIYMDGGDTFTLTYNRLNGSTTPVAVTLDGVVVNITDGVDKPYPNIDRDMHFVFHNKNVYTVTVTSNLSSQIDVKNNLVLAGNSFTLPAPGNPNDIIVKIEGKIVTPNGSGNYVIPAVNKNMNILITNKKATDAPKTIITADIHPWISQPVIDGGVILPK